MKKWWIAAVILLALLIAGYWGGYYHPEDWLGMKSPEPKALSEKVVPVPPGSFQGPPQGYDPRYVRSEPARFGRIPMIIPITGKLAYDAKSIYLASARVAGRLDRILVFEGERVAKRQALAELYSPEYVSAQKEYLLAKQTTRFMKDLGNKPELLEDARATEASARNKLQVIGAGSDDIDRLDRTGVPALHLVIRAPIHGVVTKRNLDPGAFLNAGDALMTLSDMGKLWFLGNIYEKDYARIRIGQGLQLSSDALPGKTFHGVVSYIAPSIDPVTHILALRCEVPNPGGQLRPELFVKAELFVGQVDALMVPKTAVIQMKEFSYVVVDKGKGFFQRIEVKTVDQPNGQVAILSGLKGDERVVVEGALLINRLITN